MAQRPTADLPPGYALASKRVAQQRQPVRFMYREPPDNENDSGWRFFSGDEDQTYADDQDNIGLYSVGTIAEIDPSVIPFLNTEPPCAFERDRVDQSFRASEGYDFTPEELG